MTTTSDVKRRGPRISRLFRSPAIPEQEMRPAALLENPVDFDEAARFVRLFHEENPQFGGPESRLEQVRAEIAGTGTYTHTEDELAFGARVAWRNSGRCIGRLYWRSLMVRDCRDISSAEDVFDECVEHLREATNGGRIRPTITIFAPPPPGGRGVRIRNDQLVRYAGYRAMDGSVVGDPAQVEFTRVAERFGWRGEGGAFDVLPLIIDAPSGPPHVMELPPEVIMEVPITHPEHSWFAELGLRWHGVPAIANMDLHIGGIVYTAAPFNGWYMGTEIGARNFGDADRYDLLPGVAKLLGLDTSNERSLWKDRALVEINIAVLHSFAEAGVTLTDHHTEASRFMLHVEREEKAGRDVPGDWSWLVPPMSGSATQVFHRYYDTTEQSPAYVPRGGKCPVARQPGVCPVTHQAAPAS